MEKNKKREILFNLLNVVKILVGSILLSLSVYMFTIPAKFIPGGVNGIASMVEILSGFPAYLTLLIINIPLVVSSFYLLNKKKALISLCGILLTSAFLALFRECDIFTYVNPNQPILSAIAGGFLSGSGIGLLVGADCCPGGTEITSLIIQKKLHPGLPISKIIFIINTIIISIGGILYRFVGHFSPTEIITITICSFIQIFFNSKTMDIVLNGTASAVKFEVITDKSKELTEEIRAKLGRSVTILSGQGGYTNATNQLLICVVTRVQISAFKRLLKEIDPKAFAFAIDTREVLGRGFRKVK